MNFVVCAAALVRLEPVAAGAYVLGHGVEDDFVVDLENHAGLGLFLAQPVVDVNHGHLDDVGGRALDGGVDGVTLSKDELMGFQLLARLLVNARQNE